jgi:membrane-anchored glycerophosphoryl diester phosphodiesterase (GDPDase)
MPTKNKKILVVRVLCFVIMTLYAVFRIAIPIVTNKPIYMDKNDGYILIGSVVFWLVAEAIFIALNGAVKIFFSNLANKFNLNQKKMKDKEENQDTGGSGTNENGEV